MKVVHVSPRVQARGGIEGLHLVHRTLPWPQAFVAMFDRSPERRDDYTNLNFTWRTTLGQMRRDFAAALSPHAGAAVIYHNAWGLPLFHAGDRAARRLAVCHAMPEYHAKDLPACDGLLDGVTGVTPALTAAWPAMLPSLGLGRDSILSLPIEPPPGLAARRPGAGELVLGYAGRVERVQKRLDRLPEMLRALDAAGVRYRFEILGDGSLCRELERKLGDRVRFHGWALKEEFWRIMAGWDGIVFLTECEGGPVAMLEAMALGVIPFYPRIGGSVGDLYAPRVDPKCHYPPGDMAELATGIRDVLGRTGAARAALQDKARALVTAHTPAGYGGQLMACVDHVIALPRISSAGKPPRPHWSDLLPLGLVTRAAPQLLRRRG